MLNESKVHLPENYADELPPLRSSSFTAVAPLPKLEYFNLEAMLHGLDQVQRSFLKNTSLLQIEAPSPRIVKHFKHCIEGLRNSYQQMKRFQTNLNDEFLSTGMGKVVCDDLLNGLVKSLHLVEESFLLNQWETFLDRVEFRLLPHLHNFTGSLTQVIRAKSTNLSDT